MSHLVTINPQVKDPAAIQAACQRLGLAEPIHGTAQLYSGQATGLLLQLPGWRYPVVLDPVSGRIHFDDFNGAWGDRVHLDRFLQRYATEKAKREARQRGHLVFEQSMPDGSIKLTIQEGS
jgi:hypothetical protein